ncbi:nuclear transport factor 2 family protein [Bailinhaonella thermotolerans]|uniref:Nuclear transport factor 2 family protein n=1 Tax=Bailinhaonella thermotolerans TaxID=1070861 RepID=A0A3A4AWG9_9ACTN|nr:nuclear transport factor 2 family protein [Bailinhaonella thermotolerans]RJL31704.1 nuclear transport factor 2 family protein [Bailinhaonella thermotolerans]
MPAYPREELEEMVERWLAANRECEARGDWRPLADLYTEDATYGWNLGPRDEFMAVGREEIRDVALGLEMGGLDGWSYPYQRILIDDRQGEVVGFWKQVADAKRPDGSPYEVPGIGGSWFRYGGGGRWSWQRDFFDVGNATALFVEMMEAGTLSDGMRRRMDRLATRPPGWYRIGRAPAGLWD